MTNCNKFRGAFRATFAAVAATMLALAGCTEVDDTLGSNMIPGSQEMKAGFRSLSGRLKDGSLNPKQYFETRLFLTDSIVSSNVFQGSSTYAYFGATKSDTLGLRTAGFLTQYTPYIQIDSGYFGYQPIFDSMQLMFDIQAWSGDTLEAQTFNVYEVVSDKYLTDKSDTTFYPNFDPEATGTISSEPLFTFTFPDGKSSGPSNTASVTLVPTTSGTEYVSRMMLQSGKYKDDYSIYTTDKLKDWVKEFKGFYIRPAMQNTKRGSVFSTVLDASGIALYGRNRLKSDPALIKDTLALAYFFYDTYTKEGNVSINTVKHDYAQASSPLRIDPTQAVESNKNRPFNNHVMIEGMGGVVTEITFSREFFDELDAIITEESAKDRVKYTTFAVNQAMMKIYFSSGAYNWEEITPGNLTPSMDASLARLGLYSDYKKKTGVIDYNYVYESYYSTELAYDGYINRSQGCYQLNISSYIQELWNSYLAQQKITPAGQPVDLEKVSKRVVYLGPQASEYFGGGNTVLQGMNDGTNHAPIKLDLTYTMIK